MSHNQEDRKNPPDWEPEFTKKASIALEARLKAIEDNNNK
jgi:hypothetical protein